MNTIDEWKEKYMAQLPQEENPIERNHAITSTYATLYLQNPDIFKWAGMAAFASHHVGIAMLPFKIKGFQIEDLNTSCKTKSLLADLNLIRHLNTMIYDDIAWVHDAYMTLGLDGLKSLFEESAHYRGMFEGFAMLDSIVEKGSTQSDDVIWDANTKLLRHEQSAVVQPVFDRLGAMFQGILTFCASLDFDPSHVKTDWKLRTSFIMYMYLGAPTTLLKTFSFPNLTNFDQRWTWLEKRVVRNWRKREKTDNDLIKKFTYLSKLSEAK